MNTTEGRRSSLPQTCSGQTQDDLGSDKQFRSLVRSLSGTDELGLGSDRRSAAASAQTKGFPQNTGVFAPDTDALDRLRIQHIDDKFTVQPRDRGGQVAGKGFEFQDIYAIHLMTRFLDQQNPAIQMRIEGAEDIDLLDLQNGRFCESYCQVKTVKEGKNWTLRAFDTEGVWCRFAYLISEFYTHCQDRSRSIEVVFVLDGDVGDDTRVLSDKPTSFSIALTGKDASDVDPEVRTKVRSEALASIARQYIWDDLPEKQMRDLLRSAKTQQAFRSVCCSLVQDLDEEVQVNGMVADEQHILGFLAQPKTDSNTRSATVAAESCETELVQGKLSSSDSLLPLLAYQDVVSSSIARAYALLDPLFGSLRVESRIGFATKAMLVDGIANSPGQTWHTHLEGQILFDLVNGSYLSPDQATTVYEQILRPFVRRAAQVGLVVTRELFNVLLISRFHRTELEDIPSTDGLVPRSELVSQIVDKLDNGRVVYLYGFSKIGKTSLAAMVAQSLTESLRVFWHTLAYGEHSVDRLVSDLCWFIGEITGSRNLYTDWQAKKLSPMRVAQTIRRLLVDHSVLLVLDNCHVLTDMQQQTVGDLLRFLVSGVELAVKIMAVGEDSYVLPALIQASNAMRVHGLSLEETISLLRRNGCSVNQENYLDFCGFWAKVDGHPVMLQISAASLPKSPSAEEVKCYSDSLADLTQDTSRFFDQLSHNIFKLLTSEEQKEMLRRLSVLMSGCDRGLCFALADCEPPLAFRDSDWRRLVARVLDRSSQGKFKVPPLFKGIAVQDVTERGKLAVYQRAASHILKAAKEGQRVDFWDFQDAITYLALAGDWSTAIRYFIASLDSNPSASYSQLRLLFGMFEAPAFRDSGVRPELRCAVAIAELGKILDTHQLAEHRSTILRALRRGYEAATAIEDARLRSTQMCLYYFSTSRLYSQGLVDELSSAAESEHLDRESPLVRSCSHRALVRARKAFGYALLTEEPFLVQAAFAAILHANNLTAEPLPHDIPSFLSYMFGKQEYLAFPHSMQDHPDDLWRAISDTYRRYTLAAVDSDAVRNVLARHLEFAQEYEITELELAVGLAIAHWHFERESDCAETISVCNHYLPIAATLVTQSQNLRDLYVLRADTNYRLEDYEKARSDYQQAQESCEPRGMLTLIDLIVQYRIGDCGWYLGDYRAAVVRYTKALDMRSRIPGTNPEVSFKLFGKLSLAYFSMGFFWNSVDLHRKMLSMCDRLQDDEMAMKTGGSLLSLLSSLRNSPGIDIGSIVRESARPQDLGPRYFDAPIVASPQEVSTWMKRTSKAGFRLQLADAYSLVGDTENAIRQNELALTVDSTSSYTSSDTIRSLCYHQLSQLYAERGDKNASARAAFQCIALVGGYLTASAEWVPPPLLEGESLSQERVAKLDGLKESMRDVTPSKYAQMLFRELLEPTIRQELNTRRSFEEQATYFILLVEMAKQLPPSVAACIEAFTTMYLGLFYASRGYSDESEIAFELMQALILEHGLMRVEVAYLLHTTFDIPARYDTEADFLAACITAALGLVGYLPESGHLFDDFGRRFVARLSGGEVSLDYAEMPLATWYAMIPDPESRFYHTCAIILLIVLGKKLWSAKAELLLVKVLMRCLPSIASEDLYELYDLFGESTKSQAQGAIMNGRPGRAQQLVSTLYRVISYAIRYCEARFSQEQVAKLRDYLYIAEAWGADTSQESL